MCITLQREIHKTAVEHGWWPDGERNIGEALALIHSEISEALEEWRAGRMALHWEGTKPCGFWTEMADAVIRIYDLAEAHGISIESEVRRKHDYNKTRPYRHGGKRA